LQFTVVATPVPADQVLVSVAIKIRKQPRSVTAQTTWTWQLRSILREEAGHPASTSTAGMDGFPVQHLQIKHAICINIKQSRDLLSLQSIKAADVSIEIRDARNSRQLGTSVHA